jgi:hypothetical protein
MKWKGSSEIMRVLKKLLQFVALVIFFLFMACTSTKFTAIWKDDTYQGRPEKILVINSFKDPANRRVFEDEFVKAMKDRRIDAVVSYTVMPDPAVSDMDTIAAKAKAVGADTVLINKPLGTSQGETNGVFGTYIDVYVNTKTDVYDMKSNRLVLSASAETWIREGVPYTDLMQSFVQDLVNKLSHVGLF